MNTRIRYSKLADGTQVSMRIIKSDSGREFRAGIMSDGKSGFIEDAVTKQKALVMATSPHKLKIKIKDLLVKEGCRFKAEVRSVEQEESN